MNVQSIKKLIENHSIEELKSAEDALMNELNMPFEVEGEDEGEMLTHLLAAMFCKEEMSKSDININQAIRMYSQRVRNSIS